MAELTVPVHHCENPNETQNLLAVCAAVGTSSAFNNRSKQTTRRPAHARAAHGATSRLHMQEVVD